MTSTNGSHLLRELPCPDCRRPQWLDPSTGTLACTNPSCSAVGMDIPLWEMLDRAGIDHNPPGPRPAHQGRPVPWLTPVTSLGPHWRLIHRGRLAAAQREWLCQMCGLPAPTTAALIIGADGWCLTSAPLHPADCAQI